MQLFVLITNITMIKLDTVPDISVGRILCYGIKFLVAIYKFYLLETKNKVIPIKACYKALKKLIEN